MIRYITVQTTARMLIAIALAGLSATAVAHGVHDTATDARVEDHDHAAALQPEMRNVRSLVGAFRQTGDDTHLATAQTLIDERLADARHVEDLIDAAFIAQAQHRFDTALALLDEALAIRPGLDQAWLLRSSVLLVRGDAKGATASCRQLRHAELIVIAACHARTAIEPDTARASVARLNALLRVVDDNVSNPEIHAWLLSVAADLHVTSGKPDRAIKRYRDSLTLAENVQVRAALSDLLLDAGRNDEAANVLDAGAPALPLLVRRMIAAKRTTDVDRFSELIEQTDREFQRWIENEDWLHAREMARFYVDVIDRPILARALAELNLKLQREREDLKLAARTAVEGSKTM